MNQNFNNNEQNNMYNNQSVTPNYTQPVMESAPMPSVEHIQTQTNLVEPTIQQPISNNNPPKKKIGLIMCIVVGVIIIGIFIKIVFIDKKNDIDGNTDKNQQKEVVDTDNTLSIFLYGEQTGTNNLIKSINDNNVKCKQEYVEGTEIQKYSFDVKSSDRVYNINQYCSHNYSVKGLLLFNHDAAIIVINANNGITEENNRILKILSDIGTSKILVFVEGDNTFESTIKSTLNNYGFNSNTPIIYGSTSNKTDVDSLIKACDNWIDNPIKDKYKPFLSVIDDARSTSDGKKAVNITIDKGQIKPGVQVELIGYNDTKNATIESVKAYKKDVYQGKVNDNVELLLRNFDSSKVSKGKTITKNGNGDFRMTIADIITISGLGTYITGRVENGDIKLNDQIEINGEIITVSNIKILARSEEYAEAGEEAEIIVSGIDELERGQTFVKPGSILSRKIFKAIVYIYNHDEAGNDLTIVSGLSPQFYFRNMDTTGIIELSQDNIEIAPGNNGEITVELNTSVALEKGTKFKIRTNGRTIGIGVVIEVVE